MCNIQYIRAEICVASKCLHCDKNDVVIGLMVPEILHRDTQLKFKLFVNTMPHF